MRLYRLLEPRPLLGRLSPTGCEFASRLEHAIDAGGAHGHDVSVEHHVGQPTVSFQRVKALEGDDRGLLQSSNQKSRGMTALCWLAVPSRRLQRLNLLRAMPSHATKSTTEGAVRLAQRRMNWTTELRVDWGTHVSFRAPQVLFLT